MTEGEDGEEEERVGGRRREERMARGRKGERGVLTAKIFIYFLSVWSANCIIVTECCLYINPRARVCAYARLFVFIYIGNLYEFVCMRMWGTFRQITNLIIDIRHIERAFPADIFVPTNHRTEEMHPHDCTLCRRKIFPSYYSVAALHLPRATFDTFLRYRREQQLERKIDDDLHDKIGCKMQI